MGVLRSRAEKRSGVEAFAMMASQGKHEEEMVNDEPILSLNSNVSRSRLSRRI